MPSAIAASSDLGVFWMLEFLAEIAGMDDLKGHYERFGWVAVPVLTPQEVVDLRSQVEARWNGLSAANGNSVVRSLPCSVCHWIPEVYSLIFKPAVVDALKKIMGNNCTVYPGLEVHRNRYTLSSARAGRGWHVDSGAEGKADYLLSHDYRFAKCGIFLQDHDPDWGGTIEVVSGSHRFPLPFGSMHFRFRAKRAYNLLGEKYWPTQIRLQPGTLVIFDSRLSHRSTFPLTDADLDIEKNIARSIPPDKTKLVVYWNASKSPAYKGYLETTVRRAEDEMDRPNGDFPFFADYIRMRYPEDFPADFVEMVNSAGLSLGLTSRDATLKTADRFASFSEAHTSLRDWSEAWRQLAGNKGTSD